MAFGWSTKRVLIVVKTYPTPAQKGVEVSCTAGVTPEREWIRLFPVPFRLLSEEQQFSRYQWIDAKVRRAKNDPRPESHNLDDASIKIVKSVPTPKGWGAREQILAPLRRSSLCQIQREREEKGYPTLGLFRPARIKRLKIDEAEAPGWTPGQLAILRQPRLDFGGSTPRQQLEKIPFEFRYEFECADPACNGHAMMCTDWEMSQAFRSWRRAYGSNWEEKFRERFEREMIERNDTSFFVGTMHGHPNNWIIVGLFYPPKPSGPDLFAGL
jgi:hypothetical protein